MRRSLIFSALGLCLLFASVSCSSQITAAGRRQAAYNHFSFFINNNYHSKAPIYKRYIGNRKKTGDYWAAQKKIKNHLFYNALGHWPWEFMQPGNR
jgi:hypothetical protein